MSRKKVKLQWISNDSARRATFKKRRTGLIKKAAELSTLCDVKACVVVYGGGEEQPEIWPSGRDAAGVLARLKRLPEVEQIKQMMNQEGFMRQRLTKMQDQLQKQKRENNELEIALLMRHGLAGKSMHDTTSRTQLANLAWVIDRRMNEVQRRMESIRGSSEAPLSGTVKKEAMPTSPPSEEAKEKKVHEAPTEELQRQVWFREMMNSHDEMMMMSRFIHLPFFEHGNGAWLDACFLKN